MASLGREGRCIIKIPWRQRKRRAKKSNGEKREEGLTMEIEATLKRKRSEDEEPETETKREKKECSGFGDFVKEGDARLLARCGHISCLKRVLDGGWKEKMLEEDTMDIFWKAPRAEDRVKLLNVLWIYAKKDGEEAKMRFKRSGFTNTAYLLSREEDWSWFRFLCAEKLHEDTGLDAETVKTIRTDFFMHALRYSWPDRMQVIECFVEGFNPSQLERSVAVLECMKSDDMVGAAAIELTKWEPSAWGKGKCTELVMKMIELGGYKFLIYLENAGFDIKSAIQEDTKGLMLQKAIVYGEQAIAQHLVFHGMKSSTLVPLARWVTTRPFYPFNTGITFFQQKCVEKAEWLEQVKQNRGKCFDMVVKEFEIPLDVYCDRTEFATGRISE